MMKYIPFTLFIFLSTIIVAQSVTITLAAMTTNSIAGDLVINEFMASNDATVADQDGEFEDWIELYNNTNTSIDLSGYFLSDDEADLSQWAFPAGTVIDANGYLIVWADDDEDQEGLHANFKLSASGESIFLVNTTGEVEDVISYAEQITDFSYGRFPNGTGDFQEMNPTFNAENSSSTVELCSNNGGDSDNDGICADVDCNDNDATIGARQTTGTTCDDGNPTTINDAIQIDGCTCAGTSNTDTNPTTSDLVINEFMASNDATIADQDGEFEDWIELYNNSNSSINLAGYFLSDDAMDLTQWTFPAGTVIEAKGYLVVWADDDEGQEGLHTNFRLSALEEAIFLVDPTGTILDEVSYGEQTVDISFARFPNGTGDFQALNPTFNAENGQTTSTFELVRNSISLTAAPNPTTHSFYLAINGAEQKEKLVQIYNLNGTILYQNTIFKGITINSSNWAHGMYIIKVENAYLKLILQ